jgi:hypothetical protein
MDCNLRAAWPEASWRRPRSSEMVKCLSENQAKSRFLIILSCFSCFFFAFIGNFDVGK